MNTMPAGEYYIGDLCYVIDDEVWDEVVDCIYPSHTAEAVGKFTLKDGREFVIFSTAYGDGVYSDNRGNSKYGVDSGTIGCINLKDIPNVTNPGSDGHIHRFDTAFDCDESNGILRFGHIVINTSDEEDEDDSFLHPNRRTFTEENDDDDV